MPKKLQQPELFGFEELHPTVVHKPGSRWPLCSKCGERETYADPKAPKGDLCPECYFAYLDEAL